MKCFFGITTSVCIAAIVASTSLARAQLDLRVPMSTLNPSSEPLPAAEIEVDAPKARRFLRKNWPYLVAGALLAGAVTFFVVRDGDNDPAVPVLRFRSGP